MNIANILLTVWAGFWMAIFYSRSDKGLVDPKDVVVLFVLVGFPALLLWISRTYP